MTLEQILEQVKKIGEKYHAEQVILFGSFAKGTATKYSDIDIAVSGVKKIEFLRQEIEKIETLRSFDIVDMETCGNEFLVEEIRRYGRKIL